ncbi:WcaI family glycosyltransferase [Aurantibacter sp.]|uniref:WcaI family glycosyltransferase n=1 Tax=Aurantibacter sp. TaxID=2807103 RepID=UPI003264A820
MKKKILLIGYNFYPELTGIGKYSGEMIEWLAKEGYVCTVITTYPYYPYWKIQEPYRKRRFWYKKEKETFDSGGAITIYRCPMYVPRKPTGKKRMLLDFSFFASVTFQLAKLAFFNKFDFIFTVAPSFQLGILGNYFKKIRKGKHIYHVQDLQIEVAKDLEMIKSKKLLKTLFKLENSILNKSDVVSSISENMVAKIEGKTESEVILFPNWVDNKIFYPLKNQNQLKVNYGYQPKDKVVLYSGAIGEKQGLIAILKTAKKFETQPNIKFAICGTGPYKKELQRQAKEMNLKNLGFFPLQPLEKFNTFLNMATVHLVMQKTKASDLVLPSKLTSILAVGGLSLITADKGSNLYHLVDKYKMGILVPTENQQALDEGLEKALNEENGKLLKHNARIYSEKNLNIDNIMQTFKDAVLT